MDLHSRDGALARSISEDVSILAPKEKPKRPEPKMVHYRAPPDLIKEIDAAAKKAGVSRNEAMTQFLRFALEHEKEPRKRSAKEH